jgi:hypothetical protein
MKQKNIIKLTESDLQQIIKATLVEALEENQQLEEGWFGNMFKAGAQTVGNKLGKAYNDFAGRMNTMNAQEQGEKADNLSQQLEAMPMQIKQQVAQYRAKLMGEVNRKVSAYAKELKADMAKQQNKLNTMRNKQQSYADRAAMNQQKYNQYHNSFAGINYNEQ